MKDVVVAKFGGSSLADSIQMEKVKNIIKENENRRYIIPSAPGKRHKNDHKITDLLYMCYQLASHNLNFDDVFNIIEDRFISICKELKLDIKIEEILSEIKHNIVNGGSRDYCASRGEYLNGIILSKYLGFEFIDPKDIIQFDYSGVFDGDATQGKVKAKLKKMTHAVIPGFYGAKPDGKIKTFSRGGSDVTGSIIARGVNAKLYENWTDVSGFLMADPSIVKDAKPIKDITYRELRELSYMGAPVLHEESVFPVKNSGIPINIKNTNSPKEPGTTIIDDLSPRSNFGTITGIAGKKDFTVISIEKTLMSSERDFFRKLISVFETNDILIEHMPSSIDSVSVIVSTHELNSKLKKIIEEIRIYCQPDNIIAYPNMALIAVVGRGMISTTGASASIFKALADADVNIRMISQGSSELNVIVGIENSDFEKAVASIYREFEKGGKNDEKI